MSISIEDLRDYLFKYISEYRNGFERFVSLPPEGPGYPRLVVSPFLESTDFQVFLCQAGVVFFEIANEPEHQWFIAGGPALMVDLEPTKRPIEVTQAIQDHGLEGKPIGIYRIVAKEPIPNSVWQGRIRNISYENAFINNDLNVTLHICKVKNNLKDLICDLTFGAYGIVLDPHLPDSSSPIGEPYITDNMGFFPADLNNRRFFSYLEIYGHADKAAWDRRNINIRVNNDLRRDFVKKLSQPEGNAGGFMSFGTSNNWIENYSNRLGFLKNAIDEFRNILLFHSNETEDVFHKLIEDYPILLDVYGHCESKPQFKYPEGERSPVGKAYLEPDFIITYPGQSYKLVELERASKNVATKQGQPRAEVGQAVFQTAEWVDFISEHYSVLKNTYPGINSKLKTSVIIGRSIQSSFVGIDDMNRYKGLIIKQYSVDEILTYDDLFERACAAYTTLTGLSPHSIEQGAGAAPG